MTDKQVQFVRSFWVDNGPDGRTFTRELVLIYDYVKKCVNVQVVIKDYTLKNCLASIKEVEEAAESCGLRCVNWMVSGYNMWTYVEET